MKKDIYVTLLFLLGCFVLTGCIRRDKYSKDSIIVAISSEYKDKFLNMEFVESDFDYYNISKISYGKWYDKTNVGVMTIYLKNTGKKQVLSAIEHFQKLSFVINAEKNYIVSIK